MKAVPIAKKSDDSFYDPIKPQFFLLGHIYRYLNRSAIWKVAFVTRNPIAAALVFETSLESFARPNLSKVVQYSRCKIVAFLLYIIAPSQGNPISSTSSSSSQSKDSSLIDSKSSPLDLTAYL